MSPERAEPRVLAEGEVCDCATCPGVEVDAMFNDLLPCTCACHGRRWWQWWRR